MFSCRCIQESVFTRFIVNLHPLSLRLKSKQEKENRKKYDLVQRVKVFKMYTFMNLNT